MSTLHAKQGALYLGLTTAVPITEATKWALTIDADKVDDSAFGDLWETRLKSPLTWSGTAEGNFDTASSDLFDIAASTGLCKAYLYPGRADATRYYYGTCWPNLTIDAVRTDVGRVAVAWEGSGALAYQNQSDYERAVLADAPYAYYRLGEASGTTAADSSGNARHGSYATTNVTRGVPGLLTNDTNLATAFPGSATGGNFVNLNGALVGFNGLKTLEFWLKMNALPSGTPRMIFDTGPGPRFTLAVLTNGVMEWSGFGARNIADVLADGQPHHYVCTFNDVTGVMEGWRDGGKLQSWNMGTGFSFGGGFGNLAKLAEWYDANDSAGTTSALTGTLDEFAFYLSILSPARILAHYNVGMGA